MNATRHLAPVLLALTTLGTAAAADLRDRPAIRRTPIVEAVERVRDAVVNISTERIVNVRSGFSPFGPGDPFDRFFEEFWSSPVVERRKVETPLGSGCIITVGGLVITNEHVVRRATTIYLTLDTGERFEAQLLGADPDEDLALLRTEADRPLTAIPIGVSTDLMLGETVVALGNPFGFENSVTSGIISALDREISVGGGASRITYTGLIQTSALINPGNSGGPLVNVLGEMIGINTAVVDQAQGIGFAIPVGHARDVLAPLLTGPRVSEAWIGLRGETDDERRGIRVTAVEAGGPADGKLQPGDLIEALDDLPVQDLFDMNLAVAQRKAGEPITLRAIRGERTFVARIVTKRMPEPSAADLLREKLGVAGQNLTPERARPLGVAVDDGVLITDVFRDGPAARIGLIRGDVIIQLGAHPVRNLRDAAAALLETRPGQSLVLMIVRQNYRAYAPVTIPR